MVFLDIAMREFLADLKKKLCDDVDMATSTGLEHCNDLDTDLHRNGLEYWSLIINLVQ